MVVAVKIQNPKASGSKAGRVQGLAQYIAEPQVQNASEKCVYLGARGFLSTNFQSQIAEMISLADECVKSKDPIRHDVITFREGELPTANKVEEVIDLYLKEMGLQGHQIIYGLHADTDNTHVHIEVNRVHPDTLKAVKIDRGFDKEALQRVCARIEHAQGWKPENNSRYHVQPDGTISDRPARSERAPKPSAQAQGMETRTGIKSAERIVIEDATGVLKSAKSWGDVHQQLEQVGIRYQRSGGGAIMFVGDVAVKASVVERAARFASLQKKLGPFELKIQEKQNVYFSHELSDERAAERTDATKEQDSGNAEYRARHGLLRLSECRLAVSVSDDKKRARVLQIDARTCRRLPDELRRPETASVNRIDRSNEPLHNSLFPARSGWHKYANARGEHYKNRRIDTEATRQRHAAEREALKVAQRAERSAALPKLRAGESRAGMTNVLKSLMKSDQAKAKLDLKERHSADRAALKVKYPQFSDTYEQWLIDRGEAAKAQKWRYRENPADEPCVIVGVVHVPAKKMDLRDFAGSIEGSHVRYVNRDGLGFVDRGRNIVIEGWRDESVTLAALQLSASKWGSFQVTGNDEYKAMCCKLAAQHGFKISNPELQKRIQEQRDLLQQAKQRQAAAQDREREHTKLVSAQRVALAQAHSVHRAAEQVLAQAELAEQEAGSRVEKLKNDRDWAVLGQQEAGKSLFETGKAAFKLLSWIKVINAYEIAAQARTPAAQAVTAAREKVGQVWQRVLSLDPSARTVQQQVSDVMTARQAERAAKAAPVIARTPVIAPAVHRQDGEGDEPVPRF